MSTAMDTAIDWARVGNYARKVECVPPKTQYELPGVTIENHIGVPVAVVPLRHAVVTARLNVPKGDTNALKAGQKRLDNALEQIESVYPLNPGGILTQIAYGLSYFKEYIPARVADKYMPRALDDGKRGDWALIDSIRFPKDPDNVVLEQNDISFHFKSDYAEHINDIIRVLFYPGAYSLNGIPVEDVYIGDLFNITSIRRVLQVAACPAPWRSGCVSQEPIKSRPAPCFSWVSPRATCLGWRRATCPASRLFRVTPIRPRIAISRMGQSCTSRIS